MANHKVPLSTLFSNPVLRAAFERSDRDRGAPFTVPAPVNPSSFDPAGAAVVARDERELVEA